MIAVRQETLRRRWDLKMTKRGRAANAEWNDNFCSGLYHRIPLHISCRINNAPDLNFCSITRMLVQSPHSNVYPPKILVKAFEYRGNIDFTTCNFVQSRESNWAVQWFSRPALSVCNAIQCFDVWLNPQYGSGLEVRCMWTHRLVQGHCTKRLMLICIHPVLGFAHRKKRTTSVVTIWGRKTKTDTDVFRFKTKAAQKWICYLVHHCQDGECEFSQELILDAASPIIISKRYLTIIQFQSTRFVAESFDTYPRLLL